ncbi:MAG TPA: PD-(D/E)XK nuclease family protein [Nitrospirae bacterium]|nr:ATP-dependent helicase/deoxyribonuclease subunit B [bacterium BMS3Bbin09]HDN94630.1 PD-(D/E)XK nuclease family protein [Nitrospirota bacterium]HDZ84302.1 PD-(D/E)XK nuclease family protein [Nitrospirota bacterium]
MEKTTLFITPPGTGNNKEPLFDELLARHTGNDYSPIIYLSPDNFLLSEARDLFFSYRRKKGGEAYIPFRSVTVRQFAADLYGEYGGKIPVSGRIRTLILSELLREKGTGYAALLSDLFRKSRNYLPYMELSGIKEKIGKLIAEETAKERALQAFGALEQYEDELNLKELADPEDMLRDCITFIKEAPGFETLVIDGFLDPSPLEFEVIKALIEKAGRVYALVEENTQMLAQLRSYQKDIVIKRPGPGVMRKTASYCSYPSIEDEVEGIAKGIKKLIIEGMRPWEITVCFPSLAKYLPMVQRIFRKYSVPADIGEYNISATRPFMLIEEMITCMEEDYPRSDLLSILASPYLSAVPGIVRERAVAYSYRAGIVKGKESWRCIRETLLNAHRSVPDKEKQELVEFQKGLGSIINIIEGIKREKDLLSFVDLFESALTKLGFFDSLGDNSEISEKIIQQFSELRNFAWLYAEGSHNSSPGFYLRYILKDLKGSIRNREGVRLLPFELAAGAGTKALFFGGILEGDFPSRPGIDPILPDKVKKALGMPHLDHYLKRQKQYFNRLLNVSLHDPYFSCPSADGDKVFLPSPFLEWGEAVKPQSLNIFSEEEVLEREGSISNEILSSIYWSGGMFRTKSDKSALQKRMAAITRGSISVTDIDFYRKCPLRFYIGKVLGLEKESPPKFEVESRLWGSLAHKTMEHLFKEGDVAPEMLEEKILEGLEKGLEHFPVGDFWSIVAKEIFLKIMPRMKEQENDIRIEGFSPYMVEQSIKAELSSLKLRGKIDRVDMKEGGAVILLDYKTGGIDSDSLQLPLYAFMWQETSSGRVEKVGYYSLKEGRVKWYPGKKIGMEEFISNAVQSAEELVGQISKGEFSHEPFKPTECRYCDHSPLCGAAK